jgi:RTX calcium-binding nonapeptide repeat (4 copies)
MDLEPKTSPSTGVDETFPDFASGSDRTNAPRVLPVIVQPVVPETTGAIASQAIASVPRPSEGTIRVIDTAGLAEINFNFAPSDVHIAALDVDLVMVFSDSSKLILPNLAVGLLGANPPKLNFLGKAVAAQSVIAAIGQVTLADATPSIHFSSSDFLPKKPSGPVTGDQEKVTGQDGIGSGEPPVPPQPILSGGKFDNRTNETQTKAADFQSPPVPEVTPGVVTSGSNNNAISNPSVVTPSKNIEENPTKASFAFDSVVTAQLLQTVGAVKSGNQIKGATGTGAADTNADFAVQNTKEVLTGNATSDEIWGENPDDYPAGTAGRSLQITLPSTSVTTSKVTISGVPDTIKILNATFIGGGFYQMQVGSGNTFTLKLAYKLPDETSSKDADGFYAGFKSTFSFEFSGVNTKGEKGTVSASAIIGVRDVTSAADQILEDSKTGKISIGLSRDPTGNIVNAGDGDDTVHGAAGADCIDGGDGHDRVAYDLSNDAVSVNLATGTGAKGFARGDTYINIEDVIGSNYNDTLIGNGADNLLSGGRGDDSLVGGAGRNTLVGGVGADTLDGTDGSFDLADY